VIDAFVNWKTQDIFDKLREAHHPEKGGRVQALIVDAVEGAVAEAARKWPAPANPFKRQHALVSRMYHIFGVPGGTASTQIEQLQQALDLEQAPVQSSLDLHRTQESFSGWLYKRSWHLKEWRRRFLWVENCNLCYSDGPDKHKIKEKVALTAGATRVTLAGCEAKDLQQTYPPSIVRFGADQDEVVPLADSRKLSTPTTIPTPASAVTGAEGGPLCLEDDAETSAYSHRRRQLPAKSGQPPTRWVFKVETTAVTGPCPANAATLHLCAESEASRNSWVHVLAESIRAARRTCYRLQPSVPPDEFGTEALLADGCIDDHPLVRYEAGLLGHLDQTQS